MTTVKNFGVPVDGEERGGILMPLLSYRFRIIFPMEALYPEQGLLLTQQVIKCSFNFAKKEFKVKLRQPITKGMLNLVKHISTQSTTIIIEPMNGGNNPLFSIHLFDCKCTDHSFELDYGSSSIAVHSLTFEYSFLNEENPTEWVEDGTKEEIGPGMTPAEAIKKADKKAAKKKK